MSPLGERSSTDFWAMIEEGAIIIITNSNFRMYLIIAALGHEVSNVFIRKNKAFHKKKSLLIAKSFVLFVKLFIN